MTQKLRYGVALLGVCVGAQGAFAQTAQSATPPVSSTPPANTGPDATTSSGVGLGDIIVTATRRSVNLQNVPATVEAVTSATLKAFNVTGVMQLPSLVSGLISTPSGGNNLYLRGVGSPSTGFNEAQTAVYIDGLYLSNPTVGIYSFNNIDRVEVLKGPQGTLYGRNVTGGLISVTTRDPGSDARVDASVGYANYNTFTTNAYVTVPITDNFAANVAVYHSKQSDGWSTNVFNGQTAQKSDETGVEAKALWRPATGTKVTASFIYDYNNRDIGSVYQSYPGTIGNAGTPYLGKYLFASRIVPTSPTNIYIGALKVEQDLGFATLLSTTGYQDSSADVFFQGGNPNLGQPGVDSSVTPAVNLGVTYDDFVEKDRAFSQEFQLTSKPSSSRFDWVAGAFYFNDATTLQLDTFPTCVANACAPGVPTRNTGYPKTYSESVYGDGTYRFFTATKFTVGLRYTSETRTLSGLAEPLQGLPDSVATLPGSTANPPTAAGVTYPGQAYIANGVLQPGIPTRLHFNKLTYRFVLAQDVIDHVQVYASHNLGFKSGAFNGNSFINPPVKPELLYATEAGVKSELFDRRVRLNLAYFHYTYQNVQLRSQAPPAIPGNAILENAASEHIDGVDGDFSIAVAHGLTVNGSFEYLNGRYANFPGTTITIPGVRTLPDGLVIGAPTTLQNQNLAGYKIPFAAPLSASIGATYVVDTSAGSFSLSGNDHYNSPYALVADNSMRQGRHHILDASLNWTSVNKIFDVNLFVRNLTNEYTYAAAIESANFTVIPGAPRTFGFTVGYHYR